jgi:ABC-2 type transport system permease protein
VILMAVVAGYIVLQATVISRAVTTVKVGFTPDAQVLAQPLQTAAGAAGTGIKVETFSLAGVDAGRSQVQSGKIDALVSGDPAGPDVTVKDNLNPAVEATLDGLVKQVALNRALKAAGADPTTVETAVARAGIHLVLLDPNVQQRTERTVVGVFVAALLYVALVIYGQLVAQGVVEEKANRIIEILLSTVRPRQMLMGKVIGIGVMGLMQLTLVGIVAFITISRTQALSVPSVGVDAVAEGLLWFVLGFLLYALLYAAGGSMVSRQEDIASVTVPLTMLIVGTYLAFFWVVANPDNPLATLLSVLPPFAPILMPARMATGDAPLWTVGLAIVLMLGAIAAVNWLAARIYANSVLRVGTRVRLMQAWRGTD